MLDGGIVRLDGLIIYGFADDIRHLLAKRPQATLVGYYDSYATASSVADELVEVATVGDVSEYNVTDTTEYWDLCEEG